VLQEKNLTKREEIEGSKPEGPWTQIIRVQGSAMKEKELGGGETPSSGATEQREEITEASVERADLPGGGLGEVLWEETGVRQSLFGKKRRGTRCL